MTRFSKAPTVPCGSLATSVAGEVIAEARAILDVLPTGEWGSSMKERLHVIETAVRAWDTSEPGTGVRRQITAAALDLFSEMVPVAS